MPAINPEKLAQEIKEIQQVVGNPLTLRWRIVELFEFYSDRTRRSQSSLKVDHADKKYGIPRPVLNALERGLKQSLSENQEIALGIATDLWEVDYRETRYLSIALLDDLTYQEILHQAEIWVMEADDLELLKKLAQTLVSAWAKVNYQDFSALVKDWIQSKSIQKQHFVLLVFRSVAQDTAFSDLPSIFKHLKFQNIAGKPELKRAFHDLLRVLIERSQSETARFLLDVLEKDASVGNRLIRSVLEYFPSDQQTRLRRALST